jgi:hypothetical protein
MLLNLSCRHGELQRQVMLQRSTYPVKSPTVTFERLPVAAWNRSAAGPRPLMRASSISACDDNGPTGTASGAPLAPSLLPRPLQLSPLLLLLLLLLLVTDRCSCRNVPARASPCEIRQRGRTIPLISAVRSRFCSNVCYLIDGTGCRKRAHGQVQRLCQNCTGPRRKGVHTTQRATRVDQKQVNSLSATFQPQPRCSLFILFFCKGAARSCSYGHVPGHRGSIGELSRSPAIYHWLVKNKATEPYKCCE